MRRYTLLSSLLTLYASLSYGQILNIVAHQDDDLLFISPDLLHYIQTGQEVRTVFITAGDSGRDESYWHDREAGARSAYAVMSDAPNSWTEEDAGIPGHQAPLFSLDQDPSISLVFLRLPDGNLLGQGFEETGSESLQKLWEGGISKIQPVSGTASYTKDELVDALVHLASEFAPERVNTLDYVHQYGDGDHSDHHSTGYFVAEALKRYGDEPTLAGYVGYPVVNITENVEGADLLDKKFAYYAYASHDPVVCDSDMACADPTFAPYYPQWLARRHTVDASPIANAGALQFAGLGTVVTLDGSASSDPNDKSLVYEWTQVSGPSVDLKDAETSHPSFTTPGDPDTLAFELVVGNEQTSSSPAVVRVTTMRYPENIALKARVTASSSNVGSNQTPDKAIDGSTGGFPAGHSNEWATDGGKAGSWLTLSWEGPQMISQIALYDRPNLQDQITGAVVEFDDGERIEIGELGNYGTLKTVDAAGRTANNLTVRITEVSPSTTNVGLAEIQVFGTSVD